MNTLIEKFVSELAFERELKIMFRGETVFETSSKPEKKAARFPLALTECVYKYLYTHPDGNIGGAFKRADDDPELLAAFAAADTRPSEGQTGWVIDHLLDDGSVVAARHSKTQKFRPGQYVADSDRVPIKEGDALTTIPRLRSCTQQSGFYFVFSRWSLDLSELPPMVRLYWNVRRDSAAALLRTVVDALDRYEIAFDFKIATRACDYSRRDCAVLYLPRRMYRVATMALASKIASIVPMLQGDEPLFTRRLAPGVGVAEDPGSSAHSFGSSRCEMLAEAILAARDAERIPLDRFRACFAAAVHARRLSMDALHLNPKSEDIYDVSEIWRLS